MADQNVTISQDTVVISGGTETINVDVNFGDQGTPGNLILYGQGKPTDPDVNIKGDPQILDWYINIDNTDDEYLYIYQYAYINEQATWTRVFKIIPNTYQTNKSVTFSALGTANVSVRVSNTTLPLVPQYAFPGAGSTILPAASEAAMLALPASTGVYAFRTDLAKYYYLAASPASSIKNWKPLIAINAHVDIENEYPVASAFQIGTPTIDQDAETGEVAYLLPMTLTAAQVHPTLGLIPLSGTKTAHISINVV